jgi:hypothetical protein
MHHSLCRTKNNRFSLKACSPAPHLLLQGCLTSPCSAVTRLFSRFVAARSGSLAIRIHISLFRTSDSGVIELAPPWRHDFVLPPPGGSPFAVRAFARHAAALHVETFRGSRCMVHRSERWTERNSTRDSSGRNGVMDDFGLQ